MKKQHIIFGALAIAAILALLYLQKRNHDSKSTENNVSNGIDQGGESHPDQPVKEQDGQNNSPNENGGIAVENPTTNPPSTEAPASGSATKATTSTSASTITEPKILEPAKKESNCFKVTYQHIEKNQNRDIEDFLNDTNAFPIDHDNVNVKNICVKVNDKPVNHKFVKKNGKSEVIVGSVVGPESSIQVSYCIGNVSCKESCVIKSKNKVDELLTDNEMGGLENAELEKQVKELKKATNARGDIMDSTIIRNWNKLQSNDWVCNK